jgi:hypothetical protein
VLERGDIRALKMRALGLSDPLQRNDRHAYGGRPQLPFPHLAIHATNYRRGKVPLSASGADPGWNFLEDEVLIPGMAIDGYQSLAILEGCVAVLAEVQLLSGHSSKV